MEIDFDIIVGAISFAALIIVWAFAPAKGAEAPAPARVAVPEPA